uniref:Uncharacterized protein n=1 Tax=Nothobranchius furzeri TaxID=105023 RepID=A0A8C6LML0_NOTFU
MSVAHPASGRKTGARLSFPCRQQPSSTSPSNYHAPLYPQLVYHWPEQFSVMPVTVLYARLTRLILRFVWVVLASTSSSRATFCDS